MGCLLTHLSQVRRNFPHNHNWRTHPDPPLLWMTKLEHTVFSTRDISEHHCFNPTHTFIFILGRLCSCGLSCLLEALKQTRGAHAGLGCESSWLSSSGIHHREENSSPNQNKPLQTGSRVYGNLKRRWRIHFWEHDHYDFSFCLQAAINVY